VDATFIVTLLNGQLTLIDQHTGHERILFERFLARAHGKPADSQQLLIPLTIDLSAKEALVMEEQRASLAAIGFDVEPFGPHTFIVRAVPAELTNRDAQAVLRESISTLAESGTAHITDDELIKTMACKAAVKAGDRLTVQEMQALIAELQALPPTVTCPHGRPALITVTSKDLEKLFRR
jgi:DNA mismatch repair protein MutL